MFGAPEEWEEPGEPDEPDMFEVPVCGRCQGFAVEGFGWERGVLERLPTGWNLVETGVDHGPDYGVEVIPVCPGCLTPADVRDAVEA